MASLSVVIAARNEEQHLPEQLRAIQTQGIPPAEIVLVDDGSTDSTAQIMEQFQRAVCQRITVRIVPLLWVGGCDAYNIGVQRSHGTYVYCASANDVMAPGALAAVQQALEMFPGADLIAGNVAGCDLDWAREPTYLMGQYVTGKLGHAGIIHGAGAIISRRAWDQVGGWQADVGPYCDALMWHTVAARLGCVYTPRGVAWVRPNEPGQGYGGSVVFDAQKRRPYLEAFARHVMRMDEPYRSNLLASGLWDIAEMAPDMRDILASCGFHSEMTV